MQKDNIPKLILRIIYFYAGIMHSLIGEDFEQAENFFFEAIQIGLPSILKGMAYNNLACVIYWNNLKKL